MMTSALPQVVCQYQENIDTLNEKKANVVAKVAQLRRKKTRHDETFYTVHLRTTETLIVVLANWSPTPSLEHSLLSWIYRAILPFEHALRSEHWERGYCCFL